MDTFRYLVKRDDDDDDKAGLSGTTINLLISLLVLVLFALSLLAALLVLRQKRRSKQTKPELPLYNNQVSKSHHHSVTISTNKPGAIIDEKRDFYDSPSSPTDSIPEIRITFPDEEDEFGKRKAGHVVVVQITDKGGIGLKPCEEQLPSYQDNTGERFQSLDLERMGGLKEKEEDNKRWS